MKASSRTAWAQLSRARGETPSSIFLTTETSSRWKVSMLLKTMSSDLSNQRPSLITQTSLPSKRQAERTSQRAKSATSSRSTAFSAWRGQATDSDRSSMRQRCNWRTQRRFLLSMENTSATSSNAVSPRGQMCSSSRTPPPSSATSRASLQERMGSTHLLCSTCLI